MHRRRKSAHQGIDEESKRDSLFDFRRTREDEHASGSTLVLVLDRPACSPCALVQVVPSLLTHAGRFHYLCGKPIIEYTKQSKKTANSI